MSRRGRDPQLEDIRARAIAELELLRAEQEIDAPEYERQVGLVRSARSASELDALEVPRPPAGLTDPADDHGSVVAILMHLAHRSPHARSPRLRIRGFSLLGGVSVKIKS